LAGERVKLAARKRDVLGSAESRRLRKRGLIPGILYGHDEPVPIAVVERDLRSALTGAGGTHAVLDVVVDGGNSHASVLKEYQQDAVRGKITHIDLQEVRLDQPIQAQVVVNLVGEPAGVKEGGVLSQVTREITVEALPMEIPESIDLDVSGLAIGDSLRLADLPPREGVTFLDDPDETILANVSAPTRIEEEPTEVLAEGEEPVAGEPAEPDAAGAGGEGTTEG
jgi:large subunit ribosomal protein L25